MIKIKVESRKLKFNDWLVARRFNNIKKEEICLLTTRGYILARCNRREIRSGLYKPNIDKWGKVAGLRRFKTQQRACLTAEKLNRIFCTSDYIAVEENQVCLESRLDIKQKGEVIVQ